MEHRGGWILLTVCDRAPIWRHGSTLTRRIGAQGHVRCLSSRRWSTLLGDNTDPLADDHRRYLRAHDEADAFLVLHGTDTMAYTAVGTSSYALAGFHETHCLTGSVSTGRCRKLTPPANVTRLRAAGSSGERRDFCSWSYVAGGNRSTKTSSCLLRASTHQHCRSHVQVPFGAGITVSRRVRAGLISTPYARHDVAVVTLFQARAPRVYVPCSLPARGGYHPRIRRGKYSGFRPAFCRCVGRNCAEAEVPLTLPRSHQAEVVLGHMRSKTCLSD